MKIALISDLHFGIKSNDLKFQKSQISFFEKQLVEELKLRDIKNIFVLGDIFDTRQSINVQTSNVVLKLFKDIFKDFNISMIVGNHDLYYTNTTDVNSLKLLNLLPNVTVYEQQTTIDIDGHAVTFMPWITDYKTVKFEPSEYCFAHMDIIGFMMDKYNMCNNGISIKKLIENFKHVYSGHFHTRSMKMIGNCDIQYIGSPYQLTRIDAGQDRGCTILDLDTNKTELIINENSIRYVKIEYPNIPDNIKEVVANNIVDIDIPYDLSNQSKNITDYLTIINSNNPISISQNIGKKPDLIAEDIDEDLSSINLYSLFKSYVDKLNTDVDKTKIYTELTKLYNTFKRRLKMEQKTIILTNGQVKVIYEYFSQLLQQEGKNALFSYFIYNNMKFLSESYNKIVNLLYNENTDEKYQEFRQKASELVTKYAERDEQGNVKFNEQNQPMIIEQIAEFKEENEKLIEKYKEVIDNRNFKIKEAIDFLEVSAEYRLFVLSIKDFPDNTAPLVVGIFTEE